MGLVAGCSDYFLARPNGVTGGLWLELKSPIGTLSAMQLGFLQMMRDAGYHAAAAWGHVAAMRVIDEFLAHDGAPWGKIQGAIANVARGGAIFGDLGGFTLKGTLRKGR